MRVRRLLILACLSLGVVACSPIAHQHGYTPRAEELEAVRAGVDTRESVLRKLGRPSTIAAFDASDWYYISMRSETYAFYEPEVVDQRVVTVSFDDAGLVTDIGNYGLEEGRVIDLVTRTTPTAGRKLTILQQIFQNLGKYNTEQNLLKNLQN